MYIAVSFPRGIWFPYGRSDSFVPLCSVENTGLFLRIPTTLKNSEIMAIFPSLWLLFLFLYWVCLCPVSLYRFCSLLFHSEIIMCLCIYVPLLFLSTSSQDSFAPWLTASLNKPFLVIYLNLFKETSAKN